MRYICTHFTDGLREVGTLLHLGGSSSPILQVVVKPRPEKEAWFAQDYSTVGHNLKRPECKISEGMHFVCLGHNSIPTTQHSTWQIKGS